MFGAVNALFSGLAFATLIYTAWMQRDELAMQREELALTRAELSGQKAQLEQQTKTFELQRFEDSFFALLRLHADIVDAMKTDGGKATTIQSRDCFRSWLFWLEADFSGIDHNSVGKPLLALQAAYSDFYSRHQHHLGHYFRHLYHIIKFVDDAPISEKKKYTSLVRAQLSAHEHVLVFYNGLSVFGIDKFKPLMERYAFLENLPKELLISEEHLALYADTAYGEDAS